MLPVGVAFAHLQARRRYPGHGIVTTLVLLPARPAADRDRLLPRDARSGPSVMFTFWACAIAAGVMALPLVVRTVQGAFEALDPTYEEIAATLGAGPLGELLPGAHPARVAYDRRGRRPRVPRARSASSARR